MDDLLSSYDYDLPRELIASQPLPERDASRLMVVRRQTQEIEHRRFSELPDLLASGDLLVVNQTQVIPAKLQGTRAQTGGKWEGLFLGTDDAGRWRLIGQTRGRLLPGESVRLHPFHTGGDAAYRLELVERDAAGEWLARPETSESPVEVLQRFGTVPLPPYMGRDAADEIDWSRYQTTYACSPGAVAAPTAGLHFTPEVFARCEARGIARAAVTLHVGIGTFRPISVERLEEHRMHAEWCELPEAAVQAIEATRQRQGRVVAVGTTTVRTLEGIAAAHRIAPWSGEVNLFIRPPYDFQVIDALVTNFHLPKSSLLVLISAFAGRDLIRKAYAEAVRERYRFFSYGDAMLIL